MKLTIDFSSEEEAEARQQVRLWSNAPQMHSTLWELEVHIRARLKHGALLEDTRLELEECRRILRDGTAQDILEDS